MEWEGETHGNALVVWETFWSGLILNQRWFSVWDQASVSFVGQFSLHIYWKYSLMESFPLLSGSKRFLDFTSWLTNNMLFWEIYFTSWVTQSHPYPASNRKTSVLLNQKGEVRCKFFQGPADRKPSQRVVVGRTSCFHPVVIPSSWSRTAIPPLCRNSSCWTLLNRQKPNTYTSCFVIQLIIHQNALMLSCQTIANQSIYLTSSAQCT